MAYEVYRYAYDASTSSIAQDAVFAISGAPDDVDPMRWALLADSENCLYVFNTSNTIYSFQFNQDSNSYVYNDTIAAIAIANAPSDASFDSATIYYNGVNKVLILKSIQFFDVLYQFGFDQDNMAFSYGKDVSGIVKLAGAPTDLNWSRFGVTRTSNGSSLYAFQAGCSNIYQANYDSKSMTYEFNSSNKSINIMYSSQQTITLQFSVSMAVGGYYYFIYNTNVLTPSATSDQVSARSSTSQYDGSSWMSGLDDDMHLNEVNLPGTHDSAAIGWQISSYVCQESSLTDQLNGGNRFFDIRIKVKSSWMNFFGLSVDYDFATCHGSLGSILNVNEFQSLDSAFQEFKNFLVENPTEAIVISLKIDDYGSVITDKYKSNVYDSLDKFLDNYKLYINKNISIPQLKDMRGCMYLINRICRDNRFGAYIHINDNTEWQMQPPFSGYKDFYSFYQDRYNYQITDEYLMAFGDKLGLIAEAFSKYSYYYRYSGNPEYQEILNSHPILLNFISGNTLYVFKLPMNNIVINYLGSFDGASRPQILGWCPMDFALSTYNVVNNAYEPISLVQLIIDSNFGYAKYPQKFIVDYDG